MAEMTSDQLLEHYDRGALTVRELLKRLTPTNVEPFFEKISEEDRQTILKLVKTAPEGADDWDKLRLFQAGGWCNVTQGQVDEYMRIEKEKFRTGVESVRNLVGK